MRNRGQEGPKNTIIASNYYRKISKEQFWQKTRIEKRNK